MGVSGNKKILRRFDPVSLCLTLYFGHGTLMITRAFLRSNIDPGKIFITQKPPSRKEIAEELFLKRCVLAALRETLLND